MKELIDLVNANGEKIPLSMIDIGCGPMGQMREAKKLGFDVLGIDGDPSLPDSDLLIRHDFTKGAPELPANEFGLAWSCEFVEHVEEQYVDNFIDVFKKAHLVVMTAAPPESKGHHHVNCRNQDYWIDKMESMGFSYGETLTEELKKASTMKREFFKNTGMAFYNMNMKGVSL